jgi:hypothetical protein
MSLFSDGRYNKAKVQFIKALKVNKRVLSAKHPNTLTSIANLALTYPN